MRDNRTKEIIKLLEEYKDLVPEIQELNKKLNEFIELKNLHMDTLKAVKISDMPKSEANKIADPVGDLVAKCDVEMQKYLSEINKLIDKKKLIEKMLSILEPIERKVIEMRYINDPPYRCDIWEWIGNSVHYSRRQAIRINYHTLEKMAKWYNT